MRVKKKLCLAVLSLLLAGPALSSDDPAMDARIAELQTGWAHVKYEVKGEDAQQQAMDSLAAMAKSVTAAHPGKAEPLIWEAIILSTEAGIKGGMGALSLVKDAKAKLEEAERINPAALDGSVSTSLGSLYYQVPGFPLGFGNDKKARAYLEKALVQNPDGLDSNYFYGDFLFRQGEYVKAREALTHALAAAPRPGREVADLGRREEINDILAKVEAKLNRR